MRPHLIGILIAFTRFICEVRACLVVSRPCFCGDVAAVALPPWESFSGARLRRMGTFPDLTTCLQFRWTRTVSVLAEIYQQLSLCENKSVTWCGRCGVRRLYSQVTVAGTRRSSKDKDIKKMGSCVPYSDVT